MTESHGPRSADLPTSPRSGDSADRPTSQNRNAATTKIPAPVVRPNRSGKHLAEDDSDALPPLTVPHPGSVVPVGGRAQPDSLVGTMADSRYVIEARIVRDDIATVYRAKDTHLDRPATLKIMYPHLAESQDFVARFHREAHAVARLTHPGVVAVYDRGTTEGLSYLVMELVQGPNLRTYLRS